MSKFCGNCGAQLSDDARICGYCGAALEPGSAPEVKVADPEKKKKLVKGIKLATILAAVVTVLVIALNIASGFVGYKGLTRKVMKAYKDYELEELASTCSWFAYEGDNDRAKSRLGSLITSDMETMEYYVGHSYRLSHKVVDAYKMPEYRTTELLNSLPRDGAHVPGKISKVMCVEVEVTAKGDGKYTMPLELTLVKEKGTWKLLSISY